MPYGIGAALLAIGIYILTLGVPFIGHGPEGKVLTAEEKKVCGITAEVTEGPYYVSGMGPLKNGNLNYTNLPGDPLLVTGVVYEGLDNTKPLANTIVDIWHADNSGSYQPNANGAKTKYTMSQLALRGYVTTNAKGAYSFTTVYPGKYNGRTRHIHIKIRAAGYSELTTQLIVPSLNGDDITFDDDTVSKGLPNCHLLAINHNSKPASTVFDFHIFPNAQK
jgi:protocatechuate 3,4-dioxygenase beta subunit